MFSKKRNGHKSFIARFIESQYSEGRDIKVHSPDFLFLISLAIILLFGLLILIPASFSKGCSIGDCYFYFRNQLLLGVVPGLVLFFVFSFLDYCYLKKIAVPFLVLTLALLALVFISPFGISYGRALRWINLGVLSFQPSEILKLSVIIYLSAWLGTREAEKNALKNWKNVFLPFVLLSLLIFFLLISQPDMSTLAVIIFSMLLIYYLSNVNWRFLLTTIGGALCLFALFIKFVPYRLNRVLGFLYPDIDPQGIGYQAREAIASISSGGFWGKGLGQITAKALPEVLNDSIFALAAEGLGFIGGALIIFFYFFLFWRCLHIAKRAPDKFGYLLVNGIAFCFIVETIINLGAILGLLPLTGIPLPLMSYGKTSMIVFLSAFGVVTSVSRRTLSS